MTIWRANVSSRPTMDTEQAVGAFGSSYPPVLLSSLSPGVLSTHEDASSCQLRPRTRSFTH